MRISSALAGVRVLGMDTGPVIYHVEQHREFGPVSTAVFAALDAGTLLLTASTVVLMESRIGPLKQQRAGSSGESITGDGDAGGTATRSVGRGSALANQYHALLLSTPGLSLLPVDATVAGRAAELRARYSGLRGPDALHLATAIESGCDAFFTSDRRLKQVQEIPVIVVRDLTP